ncbi:MAG: hypothetical protein LBH22_02925 [Bacteroidales bacterium]|jgi:hypothetical protein|nr:hypothetical protein [Bacteroidales bacterium]
MKKKLKVGEFGAIYTQFKNKPKEAILFLKKKKDGECVKALYRKDFGYVDIVWGENDPKTNRGYGLKHIIEKHGKEFHSVGSSVEEFIPLAFQLGSIRELKEERKIIIENPLYRVVILTAWKKRLNKNLLLTAYIVIKKPKK